VIVPATRLSIRAKLRTGARGTLLIFLLGCRSNTPAPDETGKTVRALRYKRLDFESLLEFSHGAGTWHEELYFPEKNVRATLTYTSLWDEKTQESKDQPQLYAAYSAIRNKFLVSVEKEVEQPTEEVQVPYRLAQRIFALADLRKTVDEQDHVLGEQAERLGLLHMKVEPPRGSQ
jgi:hypothetical protein